MYIESDKYFNRELSWIGFNRRVYEVALEDDIPIMEKIKFLSIVSSNFDEFFMIRVGSAVEQIEAGYTAPEVIDKILENSYSLISDCFNYFEESALSKLRKIGIDFMSQEELSPGQRDFCQKYYEENVFPVLTPIVVQNTSSFPLILNKSLNIGMLITNEEGYTDFATVQVPSVLSRFIEVPTEKLGVRQYVFLEELIRNNLDSLFNGHTIKCSSYYRITRNADFTIQEDAYDEDFMVIVEESLKKRKWGEVYRLEVGSDATEELIESYIENFEVEEKYLFKIKGPLDLTFLMKLSGIQGFDEYKFHPIKPKVYNNLKENIFDAISEKDILLHHPFDSFEPVIKLVEEAAKDPKVLAIKQTLYRVSGNSPLVAALIRAAESGKQVTVLVELKARFDEENNIQLARRLEKAGCQVIYGVHGLKTHCKILLVVRMEEQGIKRYVHLGTGNYNDVTARLYTDFSLMTSKTRYGSDASMLFNMLSGNSKIEDLSKFYISPINLRSKLSAMIDDEIACAKNGKKAKIIMKINSLVDDNIIDKLYEASQAGVKVSLIIRGICRLIPGIKGFSDNITVVSIVGRFLEHSRVYYFYDEGEETVYMSSADVMRRNLDRRVELLFPVEDKDLRLRLKNILIMSLNDNVRSKKLQSDGSYVRNTGKGNKSIDFQNEMLRIAASRKKEKLIKIEEFEPIL